MEVNLSTDKPIFVLDSEKYSSSIIKKSFSIFVHTSEEEAPLRFEPAALLDHKHLNQLLYQLRHEPVMETNAFMLNNIISI